MPIDPRRRDAIAKAVAAYNGANPLAPLPRNAAGLLVAMFPFSDVCQRSVTSLLLLVAGLEAKTLRKLLRTLIRTGFLSHEPGRQGVVATYHLHLPPRRQP
jgi:hypothetical protein